MKGMAKDSINLIELPSEVTRARKHSLISYGVAAFVTAVIFAFSGVDAVRPMFAWRPIPGLDVPVMVVWLFFLFGGSIYGSWKGIVAYRGGARDTVFRAVLVLGLLITVFWLWFVVMEIVIPH